MMVHRYWRIALVAPVIGFLLGAAVVGVMSLGSNPQARAGQTIEGVVRAILGFGAVGLVVSIAALVGGVVLVGCLDRHLAKSSGARTALAALGAAGGVLVLGIVFATVQGIIGAGWAYLIITFTVALAIAAGIAAAFLVHRAERRSERTRPERVEHPLPSAWVDF
ncbi:hypothetical protein E3T46_08225 [Cryobacterium sp. Hh11]|uniref:hypothetical protein n=1 Tax=Cryobacterium sp. Hh11 TaxID=2555868 RepID=UPI001068EBC4|nr:hypothetical protein [Cryobacterium sp. Hh11]TFD51658.1 hypothetical protein E3T46_08225 [Cryobacterium sp. Hh11]